MLYKQNSEKELKDELFLNPTSEYRGAPFWSWNCKMTPELLEKQIDYLKEMGFGGFHMHSRSGMDNPYLSEEFMGLVKSCVNKAKKEKMLAWLYDEDRWPSGAAGGLITKDPKYRGRFLSFVPAENVKVSEKYKSNIKKDGKILCDYSNETNKKDAINEAKPYFVAAYDIVLDENGYLQSYDMIKRTSKAKGTKWLAFSVPQPCSGWYNGFTYVDTLSKKAIEKFVEVTHETYKKYVGDEFDKTIPAIFTDEPQFAREINLSFPNEKKDCHLAWTDDLPQTYLKAYGEELLPHIPEFLWDLPDNKISIDRYRFHDHICERFTSAFSSICGKWCDKNNIKLTGHMMEEPSLMSQTAMIGEAMRAYKYFGFPGIDMLCNRVELTTAKQTQSAVHQYGKEAMTSELYGVTNWDFDFRGHKFQGDWQAALGVTIRVPHLSWVSMKGDAKRDYPASINYQSPWFREYKYIEDHFSRLNTALTRGKPSVKIGVIHPIESYWLHWGPGKTTLSVRNQMEERFNNFINWMLFAQLDFDYISESLFKEQCKDVTNPIKVGKMEYDVIIVPGLETMRKTTFDRLKDFSNAGGKLVFMGEEPKYIDAKIDSAASELYNKSIHIPFERFSLLNVLEENREIEIRQSNGDFTPNYIYQMRNDGKCKWLFISNAKPYNIPDVDDGRKIYIKIKGEYQPLLYNTLNGQITSIDYRVEKGFTYIETIAYLHDSFLFKLTKAIKKNLVLPKEKENVIKVIDFKSKVKYLREEPNVIVLDMAEYKWDDMETYLPKDEVLRIDAIVRKKLGIPAKTGKQPWTLKEEKTEHTITLKYEFESKITVRDAKIALEDAKDSIVYLDGKKINMLVDGYFTDESIETIKLPEISPSKHIIEITKPIGQRTNTEWSYLLGDFNVLNEGLENTIIEKTDNIGFGTITSQGMPFYGGNIKYTCEIDLDEEVDLNIHANNYRGALISVKLDDNELGKIVFSPYNLKASNVSKGKHTIEFTVFGNRYNCFAALHNAEIALKWAGPGMWFTKGDRWCYEYRIRDFGILASPIISVIKK